MTPPKRHDWPCLELFHRRDIYARICPCLFFLPANHRTGECNTSNAGTCAVDGASSFHMHGAKDARVRPVAIACSLIGPGKTKRSDAHKALTIKRYMSNTT